MIQLLALLEAGWTGFTRLTNTPALLPPAQLFAGICFVAAVLLCFCGVRTYHAYFSGVTFVAVVTAWCLLWKGSTTWGNLAAGFTVVGCVLAFLAFRWRMLGAVLFSSLLMGVAVYAAGSASLLWLVAALATAGAVGFIAYGLPVVTVQLTTALFGALLGAAAAARLWGVPALPAFAGMLCAGIALQLVLGRGQTSLSEPLRGWAQKLAYRLKAKEEKNRV